MSEKQLIEVENEETGELETLEWSWWSQTWVPYRTLKTKIADFLENTFVYVVALGFVLLISPFVWDAAGWLISLFGLEPVQR